MRMVLCALLLIGAGVSLAQPAAFGRFTETVELRGVTVDVDIYMPDADPPDRFVIIAHGFGASRLRHEELAAELARAGFVAIVPDMPHVIDPSVNAKAIGELAAKLAKGEFGLPPVERAHLVLVGMSAGGLASLLASASMPGLAGWVGLDPVDFAGGGVDAAAKLTAPGVVLFGDRSGCNLFGSGRAIARAAPALVRATHIDGASHCDFEDPTNNLCRMFCGKESATTQARVRAATIDAARAMIDAGAVTASEQVAPVH